MEKKNVVIRALVEDMGNVATVIQTNGDFLSIDQEGDYLIIVASIPGNEFDIVKEKLEKILGNNFSIEFSK